MECEQDNHNSKSQQCTNTSNSYSQIAQQQVLVSRLENIPNNTEELYEWLTNFKQVQGKIQFLKQSQLLIKAIRTSKPKEELLVSMDDLWMTDKSPTKLLNISSQAKEEIRKIAVGSIPQQKELLLVVRGYIMQDKLRIINLQQKLIEVWRAGKVSKTELATIYSWFYEIIFLDNPEMVVQLISFMVDQAPELLKKIELHNRRIADRVLATHHTFKIASQREKNVFKWLFRQASDHIKQNTFTVYANQLSSINSLPFFAEIMALAVDSIAETIEPYVLKILDDLLNLSLKSKALQSSVFNILSKLVDRHSQLHGRVGQFVVGRYTKHLDRLDKPILQFISSSLSNPQNMFNYQYLQIILVEVERHLVESNTSELPSYIQVLIKLIQTDRVNGLYQQICKGIFRVISFRCIGLVTSYCMVAIQTMFLHNPVSAAQSLNSIDRLKEFQDLMTDEGYRQAFSHIQDLQEQDIYRRIYVLSAAQLLHSCLTENQFMPIWLYVIEHCQILKNRMSMQENGNETSPKLDHRMMDNQSKIEVENEEFKQTKAAESYGLHSSRLLNRDQFEQIRRSLPQFKLRFSSIEWPYLHQTRIFHGESSVVRQLVKVKQPLS